MNTFDLSRNFWNWAFDNPEKISTNHAAIYFFAIEHCNRLGGKEKFGFPSQMTMDAIGIKKHQTYKKYFNELVEFGFFKLIQESKNQYSANIISLIYALPNKDKAMDKAIIKHAAKQIESNGQSNGQSNGHIDKPINQLTNKPINQLTNTDEEYIFNFKNSLIELGIEKQIVVDWLKVRKDKKASNTETAFKAIEKQIKLSGLTANECIKIAVEKSWSGFNIEWLKKDSNNNQINTKQTIDPNKNYDGYSYLVGGVVTVNNTTHEKYLADLKSCGNDHSKLEQFKVTPNYHRPYEH